jgi:hypothetical protein
VGLTRRCSCSAKRFLPLNQRCVVARATTGEAVQYLTFCCSVPTATLVSSPRILKQVFVPCAPFLLFTSSFHSIEFSILHPSSIPTQPIFINTAIKRTRLLEHRHRYEDHRHSHRHRCPRLCCPCGANRCCVSGERPGRQLVRCLHDISCKSFTDIHLHFQAHRL